MSESMIALASSPRRSPASSVLCALGLLLLVLVPAACCDAGEAAPSPSSSDHSSAPAARSLRLELVGPGASDLEHALRQGAFFRWFLPDLQGWQVTVETGEKAGAEGPGSVRQSEDAGGAPVEVVIGLLPLPPAVRELAAGLPIDLAGKGVRFDGTSYAESGTTLTVRLPGEPGRAAGAVREGARAETGTERWLVTGTDVEAVADAANRAMIRAVGGRFWHDDPARGADYVVRETPWLQRIGRWRPDTGNAGDGEDGGAWSVDPAAERNDLAERDRWFRSLRPIDAGTVRLLVDGPATAEDGEPTANGAPPESPAWARELAHDLGDTLARVEQRLGTDWEPAHPVTVAVEKDFVTQARHTGAIGPAVTGGPADLHMVRQPADRWAVRHALARLAIERAGLAAGRPVWAIEGAALWLTGDWFGRSWQDWVPDLAAAGGLPTAAELLAPERTGDDSGPLWTPVAAAVIDRLAGETVAEKLDAFAGLDRAAAGEILASLPRSDAPVRSNAPLPAGFLRGVSLAMLNTLEGGYQAPAVGAQLDALARLGADSVSLMPFAYQGDPHAPELRFLNGSPTSETDVGVVHAARAAHARGLSVLWKPHIWVSGSGHGSWPGEIEMTSERDWAAWWRVYRRYVLHHAMLARYAGAELFSVGVELQRTVERPEWADLIAAVRRIDPGQVTYAANWGGGADRAVFWDRLDAVGVDAYYPLAGETSGVDDAHLAAGAHRVVERLEGLARRAGRPVILTEVGFAARRGTWSAPHEEGGEASDADQARAYRALLGALAGPAAADDWLRGVYVWKAFSGDVSARGDRPDFRFMGRPAEAVVASFFERPAVRGSAR